MKITGFGDYLVHLSPVGKERFSQADLWHMSFTGAEENVCAALGMWGEDVSFVTRLPENALASRSLSALRSYGIDTSFVVRGGDRMGVYYLENGASVRPSQVIYDRASSAFTKAVPGDFDFNAIVSESDVLYLTGITPALSDNLLNCSLELCKSASLRGKRIIMDINYRPSLLSVEKARENLLALAPYVTTLIGNEEHLKLLLGITSSFGEDEAPGRLSDITEKVRRFLRIPSVAVTVRRTVSSDETVIYSSFSDGCDFAFSKPVRLSVVDRVGSGDAYSAGIVYAAVHGFDARKTADFAAASCALKHTVSGDINMVSLGEIENYLSQKQSDVIR